LKLPCLELCHSLYLLLLQFGRNGGRASRAYRCEKVGWGKNLSRFGGCIHRYACYRVGDRPRHGSLLLDGFSQ
jgi:hypothetical protein